MYKKYSVFKSTEQALVQERRNLTWATISGRGAAHIFKGGLSRGARFVANAQGKSVN